MFYSFSKPGADHLRRGRENQDCVAFQSYGAVRGIALADGAGSARYGRLGADEACRAALECALPLFYDLYFQREAGHIRYVVVQAVQTALDRLSSALDLGGREALGSTLLLLCAEPQGGRYFCLHIGDGLAGCLHEERLHTISSPANGITPLFTTLTSSPDCLARTRVYRGQRAGAGFFLMSDGCTREVWDGADFHSSALLHPSRWAGLEQEMARRAPEDDHSFVALTLQ